MCCEANSWMTGEEFSKFVIEKRGIDESNGWSLSLKCENEFYYLMGYDYVFDLISKLELPPGFPVSDDLFLEKSRKDSYSRKDKNNNERNLKKYYEQNQFNSATVCKTDPTEFENSFNLMKENEYKNTTSTEKNNRFMNKNRQIRSKSINSNLEFPTTNTTLVYSKQSTTVDDNSFANESNFEKQKWSSHEEINAPNLIDSFNEDSEKKCVYKDYSKQKKSDISNDKPEESVIYENYNNNSYNNESETGNVENFRFRYEPEKNCLLVKDRDNYSIYENEIDNSSIKDKLKVSDETYLVSNLSGKETAMIRRRTRRLYNNDSSNEEINHLNRTDENKSVSSSTNDNLKSKKLEIKKNDLQINNLSKTNSKPNKNSISSN
jgi:hypothetical protein